jgi:thioredoxin 1
MVQQVDDISEFKTLTEGSKPVIVDFTAVWCGPCKRIGPVFEHLADETPEDKAIFIKVDVDKGEDIAAFASISAMPTFKVYKGGNVLDEMTGANEDKLKALVAAAIAE